MSEREVESKPIDPNWRSEEYRASRMVWEEEDEIHIEHIPEFVPPPPIESEEGE